MEYKTEKELIENWKNIIFDRNNTIDRLNGEKLTDTEMEQIIVKFSLNPIPIKINEFINGKTVSITRDNINDKAHLGKEISLNIFDKYEIKSGRNRYQIERQPIYNSKMDLYKDRRGDLELLINGMPLIHIELKKSGVPLSKATNQIMEYSHERVFTGLFSLVQIFVAMTPENAVYFANPGLDGKFDESYYFHWADFNNEVIDNWKKVAKELLSIPMAHYLIGTYIIPDDTDGVLKVLRSYQYYAITQIVNKVKTWDNTSEKGGHIWHTTGLGKTMTSFKAAELISKTTDVDKVVFLIDRIELGTQSAIDYNNFAEATDKVLETESTVDLINKLKDDDKDSKLIVTSIQKLSNLDLDDEFTKLKKTDVEIAINKKIVFIV